jgi:phosphohistidine phosphatase
MITRKIVACFPLLTTQQQQRRHRQFLSSRTLCQHKGIIPSIMGNNSHDDDNADGDAEHQQQHTTSAQDRQAAADLQARLLLSNFDENKKVHHNDDHDDDDDEGGTSNLLPSVSIDEGAHKYVLITATPPTTPSNSSRQTFVYSRRHAKYHVNVAEEFVPQLECYGYTSIRVAGGGRILRNDIEKKIHIFGYSYGFGKADHAVAKEVVGQSGNYRGYEITWYVSRLSTVLVLVLAGKKNSCSSNFEFSLCRSNAGY